MVIEVTDKNFDKVVLQAKTPVLVDFWAPWCGPCKTMSPIIEGLAEDMREQTVKIVKINVDENNETAAKYGVMSIPSIILFSHGQVEEMLVGVQDAQILKEKLEELL